MSVPVQLIWSDVSNNILSTATFAIGFPGTTSAPYQLQVRSNAADLQTFETLVNCKFFLTGDPNDINTVQGIWPTLGGVTKPELNGGVDISFDFGQTYTRFSLTQGLESNPSTWVPLPSTAVGTQGVAE